VVTDPPPVSRIERSPRPAQTRGYRVLSRPSDRYRVRERFTRQRKQRPVAELLGMVIREHRLTDEVRHRIVGLDWEEIAGVRIASKTFPSSIIESVLHVSAVNSSWVQEMQFFKARLLTQINSWVDANRVWLGPPPLVTDIRFALGMQRRESLVDVEYARKLRERHIRRTRPRIDAVPPSDVTDAERAAIRVATAAVVDDELRAVIERVRLKWNR
jgi:hypothetical protein